MNYNVSTLYLSLKQACHIWRHEPRRRSAYMSILHNNGYWQATCMDKPWIIRGLHDIVYVIIMYNILLDTTRSWVYQVLFHYNYSWLHECRILFDKKKINFWWLLISVEPLYYLHVHTAVEDIKPLWSFVKIDSTFNDHCLLKISIICCCCLLSVNIIPNVSSKNK